MRRNVVGHVWHQACSYQVHGKGKRGGQHKEFEDTERPNDRCPAGCPGCTASAARGFDTPLRSPQQVRAPPPRRAVALPAALAALSTAVR